MDNSLHPSTTKSLLIVYHSMTGGTRQMVEAAARGAAGEPNIRVRLLPAPVAQAADLLEADGYIFGTPENLVAMAGLMKDFHCHRVQRRFADVAQMHPCALTDKASGDLQSDAICTRRHENAQTLIAQIHSGLLPLPERHTPF